MRTALLIIVIGSQRLIYGKKGKFLDPVDKFLKKNFWEGSLKMEPEMEISCHLSS